MLKQNKQRLFYSLQIGEIPIYETDFDGNIKYIEVDGVQVPVESGETEIGYGEPQEFFASISMSGGEAEAQEYGLSLSDYSSVCVCEKDKYPIVEGSLIWHKSGIRTKSNGNIDKTSADYVVLKSSPSLNVDKFILAAVVK